MTELIRWDLLSAWLQWSVKTKPTISKSNTVVDFMKFYKYVRELSPPAEKLTKQQDTAPTGFQQ